MFVFLFGISNPRELQPKQMGELGEWDLGMGRIRDGKKVSFDFLKLLAFTLMRERYSIIVLSFFGTMLRESPVWPMGWT